MEKYRKAYHKIEKALQTGAYGIIILMGLRKTGKTTILKQLSKNYGGYYLDLRHSENPEQDYENIFSREENLILLDEAGYLPGFDDYFTSLETAIKEVKKKIVITGSSYGMLKQLSHERLGGGRAHRLELFPLSFEEYLLFSGKISGYGENYEPSETDLQDFYRLKNLPGGMDFVVDKEYMIDVFSDNEVAIANQLGAVRDVILTKEQYRSVIDIIAYTLNDQISLKRFTGAQIGKREMGNLKGIPISQSLIGLANKIVTKMMIDFKEYIGTIKDLAHIIRYLYHSGYLFVDLSVNEETKEISDRVIHDLSLINTISDFEQILKKYTFSVISPLLYTRLMIDLEDIVGILCSDKGLYGMIYELTVKSEAIYSKGYDIYHDSHKYNDGLVEVDLYSKGLLFEASVAHKKNNEHSVDKVLLGHPLVRVVTDEPGIFKDEGNFYRIGYPKALLMLSNGTIYNLEPN
jgi:hypothetical protein